MSGMFYKCSKIFELDLSSFNIINVTKMNEMFLGCKNISLIKINKSNIKKFESPINIYQLKI